MWGQQQIRQVIYYMSNACGKYGSGVLRCGSDMADSLGKVCTSSSSLSSDIEYLCSCDTMIVALSIGNSVCAVVRDAILSRQR